MWECSAELVYQGLQEIVKRLELLFIIYCLLNDVFIYTDKYMYIYTHTQTHTHTHIYIYVCVCVCVCVCVFLCKCGCTYVDH